MRRTLVPVALAMLLAGGCGGESNTTDGTAVATTISAEDFARQADALCGQVAADIVELNVQEKGQEILSGGGSEDEKLDRIADLLDEQLQVVSEFRRKVEALGTPSVGSEDVEQILEKTRLAEEELAGAVDAAREGDENGFSEAMQRYAGVSSESASIARESELDFAVCGAGI